MTWNKEIRTCLNILNEAMLPPKPTQKDIRRYYNPDDKDEMTAGLSDEFKSSVDYYSNTPGTNRAKKTDEPVAWQEMVKGFEQMPELKGPMLLYRGMNLDDWDELEPSTDFRTKRILTFKDYLSTTTNPDLAVYFAKDRYSIRGKRDSIPILFVMRTMEGAKGFDMRYFDPRYHEEEVVLDKGSKFKVVRRALKFKDNRKIYVIHLEQIA